MRKLKKLISLLLVAGMLFTGATFPAQAASRITINGAEIASINPPGAGNYTKYSNMLLFGKGNDFTYVANIPSDGTYHISIDGKFDNSPIINTTVGGTTFVNKGTDTARKEFYIGKAELKAGENKIVLKNTGDGTFWLYNIYVEKAADKVETDFSRTTGAYKNYYVPTLIEAEDYDMGDAGSYSMETTKATTEYRGEANLPVTNKDGKNIITLRATEWASYTFNVPTDGSYNMSIKNNVAGNMEVYFDGNEYPITVKATEGETQVANLFLKKGQHVMKLKSVDTLFEIDYIAFSGASTKGTAPEELVTLPLTEEEIEAQKEEVRPVWKEVWVSADAAAGGDGSKESPFKTIEEAKAYVKTINSAMQGDIVVKILPGEYYIGEMIKFDETDGGKDGWRVIYQGANTLEKPILSGGTHITNWEPHEQGVWKASVPQIEDMRTLYINGFAAVRARSKYVYTFGAGYDDPETEYSIDGYTISKLNFPKITNVEDAEICFNQLWTLQRVPLKDIISGEDNKWIVLGDQPHFNNILTNYNTNIRPLPGSKGYLENAYELIDEPGEFYFNKKTRVLYYYPFPEENLKTAEVIAGTTEFMLEIMGSDKNRRIEGLSFDNIDFRHSTWLDVSRTGISTFQADCLVDENFTANNVQGNGRTMPAALQIRRARDINITNCNFQNIGSSAIFMDEHVEDSKVDGNVFKDISGTAVSVGTWRTSGYEPSDLCEDIDVTNNVLRRIGLDYAGSPGIGVYYARRVKTEHNDIEHTPYTGITYGWGWGSQTPIKLDCSGHSIRYNRIVDNSNVVKDGGPIYTLGDMRNTFIQYNYLTDSRDFGGIYFDSGSAMMTCTNNVLEDQEQSGIFGAGSLSYGMTIKDNWANVPNYKRTKFEAKDSDCNLPLVYEDKNWPPEALEVMKNAGLKRGYKRLLSGLEYPTWRTDFFELENCVDDFYSSVNILGKRGFEYMEGGEGVGFHKTNGEAEPRIYDLGLNISIGNTNNGDWLAYEMDVVKDGDYQLELCYSYLQSSTDENVKSSAGVSIYLDGEKVIDSVTLEGTGSWDAYLPFYVGRPFHMTAGKHIIKVEFVNAWAFEKFSLINTEFTETEPEFDDGIMLR